jgi:hypothetical protein
MNRAAIVTLKLHRVEFGVAVVVILGLAGWATYGVVSAAALGVSADCFGLLGVAGPDEWGACRGPLYAWADAHIGGSDSFRQAMEFLPFATATLVGVPVVARELEARTAPIAWSLHPSRTRWLIGQLTPILVLVGLAAAALAIAAAAWEHDWDVWGGRGPDVTHIGHYGAGLLARMFGAFGVGVAVGALLGRQLPAFLLGFVLMLGSVNVLTDLRDGWFASHEAHVLDGPGVATDWAWRTPEGDVIAKEEALGLAPPDVDPEAWLYEHEYWDVSLGISIDTAMGWAPYEAAGYLGLGAVSVGLAIWLVNRRRPV